MSAYLRVVTNCKNKIGDTETSWKQPDDMVTT